MGRPSQGEQKDPKVWSGGYLVPREAHKEVEASAISQNALLNSLPPAIQHSPVVWLSGKATLPTMRPDEDTELSATHLQLCGPGPALFKVSVHSCHSAFLGSPPYPKVAMPLKSLSYVFPGFSSLRLSRIITTRPGAAGSARETWGL